MYISPPNLCATCPPGFNSGYGSGSAMTYGSGYQNAAMLDGSKKIGHLWNMPIQNFRIDGGSTNLYSQKVSFDWPTFTPKSPIFQGPRVRQDTGNVYSQTGYNYNFDDGGYTNLTGGIIGGGFPGLPNPFDPYSHDYFVGGMPGLPNPFDCYPNDYYVGGMPGMSSPFY